MNGPRTDVRQGHVRVSGEIRESGCARRRRKAIARRQWVLDMDVRHAIDQDRIPVHAIAVSLCGCGRKAWLLKGASVETHDDFDRDNEDHAAYCDGGY